jgi:predicted AAA+ superfamily ATPase
MNRTNMRFVREWLSFGNRKPLVIRGARQVGKTWLVRNLADSTGRQLIEINFEKNPQLTSLFAANEPRQTLLGLSAVFNQSIQPNTSLLFLDEIQAAPELLAKLRWFAEALPELPVIAAGSLLEFVLETHTFSMPVGRISYMHLEPLTFEEFLLANEKQQLHEYINNYHLEMEIPLAIHQQLMDLFKEYIIIGGMPAAVSSWIAERSLSKVSQICHDLLATYRDDFAKYRGRLAIERLDEVMVGIPKQLGQKFMFSHIKPLVSTEATKQALHLMNKARVSHQVVSTAANGIPLAAEINEKYFKEIFLDVGLCSNALGLIFNQIKSVQEIAHINKGGIAEQVVGQILRTINPPYVEPALYYWQRGKKGSSAEIDYVIQHSRYVIPIEVKAGSTGSLKSLHLFMGLKKPALGVRINSDFPSKTRVTVKDYEGKQIDYELLSLPFYLLGQIHRLIKLVLD